MLPAVSRGATGAPDGASVSATRSAGGRDGDQVGEGDGEPGRGDQRPPPDPSHRSMAIASMAWVAKAGGQTTACWRSATHSQITLAARRFEPASTAPGGAKSRPP